MRRALNVGDWSVLDFLMGHVRVLDVVGFGRLVMRFRRFVMGLWCLVVRLWRLLVGFRCLGMRNRMGHRFMGLENHVGIMLHWKSLILQWNDNRSCIGMGCRIMNSCIVVRRNLMSHFMLRG